MATILTRSFTLKAYAKVNLCLAVKYPPVDGYHQLDSVFQTLDLHDSLTFTACAPIDDPAIALTQMGTPVLVDCAGVDLPVEENLVFRAVDAIERACGTRMTFDGQMLQVEVGKHIPAGGGLGGGSSDAACALRAYAKLNGMNPLSSEMLEVARGLGADVAFFLYGGAALMGGRGDQLVRCLPDFPLPLVLMGDEGGCSTPEVYRAFDADPVPAPDAGALASAMEDAQAEPEELAGLCANNLQGAAFEAAPELAGRVTRARENGLVLNALVTGSGSTSYAVCADEESARAFEREIAPSCAWTRVAHASAGQ